MNPELLTARDEAVKRIPLTARGTLAASGEGRFKNVDFTRDMGYQGELILEKPQNGELPLILPAIRNSLVLSAQHMGTEFDIQTSEEEDKIPHEFHGEDSDQERLRFIMEKGGPVVRVNEHLEMLDYFSLDANPIWNCLFVDYLRVSGDDQFRTEHMHTFERSHSWILRKGNLIAGGAEYPNWPNNPWWKDSPNSLIDEEGNQPDYPVAPLDVNSWAYLSDVKSAELYDQLADHQRAEFHRGQAESRKALINRYYWMEEEGIFTPALDCYRRPIRIITSDAVIALWTGVVDEDKIDRVIDRLTQPDFLTRNGSLRTRSVLSRQYNPRHYQNGNPWDHLILMLAAACEKAGRQDVAQGLDKRIPSIVERGFRELHVENENGDVEDYVEEHPITKKLVPVACYDQGFVTSGVLNRTAH